MKAILNFSRLYPATYARLLHLALVATIFGGLLSMANPGPAAATKRQSLPFANLLAAPTTVPAASQPESTQPNLPATLPLGGTSLSGSTNDPLQLARSMNASRFGDQYWPALYDLWVRESGWNPNSRNNASGACGIPQALPCSKIDDHSTMGQIAWGLDYIAGRYGNPAAAWRHWQLYRWY